MRFSISEKPLFTSYQVDKEYLDFLDCSKSTIFLNIHNEKTSFAFFKRILKNGFFDVYTPIHFQKKINIDFTENDLDEISQIWKKAGCISVYMQSKNKLPKINGETINIDHFRTNYYFDLNQSEFISMMAKDARYRLRKIMKSEYNLVFDNSLLPEFSENYSRISCSRKFSKKYQYNIGQFAKLLNNNNIDFISIIDKSGKYMSGGLFAKSDDEIDYLYGSDSVDFNDSIRLLIYSAVLYYKQKNYTRLYLGGGVTENDSLATFKSRMGTISQKCSAIKLISDKELATNLMRLKKEDINWFRGFFPPYIHNLDNE